MGYFVNKLYVGILINYKHQASRKLHYPYSTDPTNYTRALTQTITFQSFFLQVSHTLTSSIYLSGSSVSQALKKGLESEFQWQPNLSFATLILISVFVGFLFDLM